MIALVLLLAALSAGGAGAVHVAQGRAEIRAAKAEADRVERERRAEADRLEQARLVDAKERARAEKAEADRLAAEKVARLEGQRDDTFRGSPQYLITLERTAMNRDQIAPRHALAAATGRRTAVGDETEANTPTQSLAHQVVCWVAIAFLGVAFGVSAAQLIPSFHALSPSTPSGWNVFLGALVACLEVGCALLLAHHLRPADGWRSLGAKMSAAAVALFAVALIIMQVTWAPAHDTIPLRRGLSTAKEVLQQDTVTQADPTLIQADKDKVDGLQSTLSQATARDQGLALAVTLGADVSAWPALSGIGFLLAARRRRALRPEAAELDGRISTLNRDLEAIATRHTLELQDKLVMLGYDPALATAPTGTLASRPRASAGSGSGFTSHQQRSGSEAPQPPGPSTRPVDGGARSFSADPTKPWSGPVADNRDDIVGDPPSVSTDDLFAAGAAQRAVDDRRWSDPL